MAREWFDWDDDVAPGVSRSSRAARDPLWEELRWPVVPAACALVLLWQLAAMLFSRMLHRS